MRPYGRVQTISTAPAIRRLAEQLVSSRETGRPAASPTDATYFYVCDELREPLCSLAGSAGFSALFSRALTLSKTEFPRLVAARLGQGACIEDLSRIEPPLTREEAIKGEGILLGNMLELLDVLIGETMTLRLIQSVWPDVTVIDRDFRKGEQNG